MADYQSTHSGVKIDTNVAQVDTNTADIASLKSRMSSAETSLSTKADSTSITTLSSQVSGINAKISSAATSSNRAIDKAYVDSSLSGKVDKVGGMGLSTNDYTTTEKNKLGALPTNTELTSALNGKQATLVSGTNIKTVNGESLVGPGNIIAGDPNAVKYTEQSLTSTQKTQARNNIGAASLEDLQNEEYIIVTTLPTPGSATMGKIYLVGPDGNGNYERYITQKSIGGSYSWVDIGSTVIDMSSKADADVVCYLGDVIETI